MEAEARCTAPRSVCSKKERIRERSREGAGLPLFDFEKHRFYPIWK
jgi:hypothetical protein